VSLFKSEARATTYQDVWGKALDLTDPTLLGDVSDLVMQLPVAQRCVQILTDSIGTLPRQVFRDRDGIATPIQPLPSLISRPSRWFSWEQWVRMAAYDLVTDHNAFGLKLNRDARGWPTFIEWLPAREVNVTGIYPQAAYQWRGQQFSADEIIHLRRRGVAGKLRDPSPFTQSALVVRWAVAAQKFGYGWFRDGATPSAVIYSEQTLNETQAKSIKERFIAATRGNREPAVLGSGLKYEKVSVPANESQFLEAGEALNAEVAHLFGMPPELVGGKSSSLTYSNLEMLQNRLRAEAVQPITQTIENGLTDCLPSPQYLKLDLDANVRVDLKTRTDVAVARIAGRITTPNYERSLMELPPIAGGDSLGVPAPSRGVQP
jgi:HK97 family phage portal protein